MSGHGQTASPTVLALITAGADVQKDWIEISVWAWGRDKESWLIDHRILEGDTGREVVWNKLTIFLGETWEHENGFDLPLRKLAVDSGYATQEVYAWARKQSQALVMAIKGVARGAALVGLPSAVEIKAGGKKLKRGLRVRPVAGGIAKLELFNNLRKVLPTKESGEAYPAGYVHLPQVDEEYLKQLCSEQLITSKNRRGYAVREWQKTRERNEALDCYVYARAAAAVEGLDRFGDRHWREMERSLGVDDPVCRKSWVRIKANHSNTGAATLNVNTLGNKIIVDLESNAQSGGEILNGGIYDLVYDGTNFILLGSLIYNSGNASSGQVLTADGLVYYK